MIKCTDYNYCGDPDLSDGDHQCCRICDHGCGQKKSHPGCLAHLGGFSFFSRRFWVAVWDVFWECSISGIRRSTGISNTECRRSWWYRYCFFCYPSFLFRSKRSYAILIVYKFSLSNYSGNNILYGKDSGYLTFDPGIFIFGRYRYAYSSV